MSIINFYTGMGINPATGYGRIALGIAAGLQAVGVELRLYPDNAAPSLIIGHAEALNVSHLKHTRRTAFPMLESNQPSSLLVDALNSQCDYLIVPAPPMIDLYKTAGVMIPIQCISPGVDLFLSPPVKISSEPNPFTFLTYSYGDTRKGGEIAFRAFIKAFGDNPDYRLWIKARDGHQLGWLSTVNHPSVKVIGGWQTEDEWVALIEQCHCFVFPSRAEGWGMPPRDVTLKGIPTLATEWLGLWDVAEWGIPIPVKSFRQCDFRNNPFNADTGLWAEPDEDALIEKIRWVADNYQAARQIALRGRDYLLKNFTWQQAGIKIKNLLLNA